MIEPSNFKESLADRGHRTARVLPLQSTCCFGRNLRNALLRVFLELRGRAVLFWAKQTQLRVLVKVLVAEWVGGGMCVWVGLV